MTDIVEQAARVTDGLLYGPEALVRPKGRDIAQALADAGLLADPARTVPTRKQIAAAVGGAANPTQVGIGVVSITQATDAVLALMDGQPTVAEVKAQALRSGPGNEPTHTPPRPQ